MVIEDRSTDETSLTDRLNALRAGVMGANDGIVSTASIVAGVVGAHVGGAALLAAGIAALAAGALSMAVGEYVSVSSQRDSQRAELKREAEELAQNPRQELEELTGLIAAQGIDRELAQRVAAQLSGRDALKAHARLELGFDPDDLSNPWQAGISSMLAFVAGGIIPLLAILLSPTSLALPVTALAAVIALAMTGSVSAHIGGASKFVAVARTVGGGVLAMTITYALGVMVRTQI
jgi:VIT1/CCC1 family predicted Fe2+/Mn2+ transporter